MNKSILILLLALILPTIAHAQLVCTETLTGEIICVDQETGQRLERREKLDGQVDYIETSPPLRRDRSHKEGRDRREKRD